MVDDEHGGDRQADRRQHRAEEDIDRALHLIVERRLHRADRLGRRDQERNEDGPERRRRLQSFE
jgi:hypothetical protein